MALDRLILSLSKDEARAGGVRCCAATAGQAPAVRGPVPAYFPPKWGVHMGGEARLSLPQPSDSVAS